MSVLLKAAGISNSSSDAPNVADVFSTYLYEGNSSTQTITNGIDLDGEGGMVWIKQRDGTYGNRLFDTERGATKVLESESTNSEGTLATGLTAFNSNGFSLGSYVTVNSSNDFASWTFRKAPRFFDVVTYTGDGVAGREIAHNLGCDVGMMIIKITDSEGQNWAVYHRGNTSNPETDYLTLNTTAATLDNTSVWNDTLPTTTEFTIGTSYMVNSSGNQYVAYLFAHDPDGENDDGMIACGSLSNNTGTDGMMKAEIGWEPQYVLYKSDNTTSNWIINDTMRGAGADGSGTSDKPLYANTSGTEHPGGSGTMSPDATGFSAWTNNGTSRIYMAIRAPMMVEPEAGTEVFAIDTYGSGSNGQPAYRSPFTVDMAFSRSKTSAETTSLTSRLTGEARLRTNTTSAESSGTTYTFDHNNGHWLRYSDTGSDSNSLSWMFKRAKGFFDVVAYTGNGASTKLVYHSLQASPELVIIKRRNSTGNWLVTTLVNGSIVYSMGLNSTSADNASLYQGTAYSSPTYIGVRDTTLATISGATYIAYLFATLDGVSKVGSYTGNGSNQNIACGFSAGARFVLTKRTDATGDWYIWDTTRGIVTGNDPHLSLNTTSAEVTSDDSIDPQSAGFTVNQVSATNINVSSATYIFMAIA